MKIVVCVKQVPDTADIKWTENNTLIRDGVASIVNPCDLYAVETALQIKENDTNSEITAVSMGPMQAEQALKYVVAMGVDNAFLLNDKFFAGSDTAATSRVLASAIKTEIDNFDLIICGQYAIDGDTAQTGPSLAEKLGLPLVSNVLSFEQYDNKKITLKRQSDTGIETVEITLPALICVQKGNYETRLPKISGRIKAQNCKIPVYNAQDIKIDVSTVGFKGSPTNVKKAYNPLSNKNCKVLKNIASDEAADLIISEVNGANSNNG